MRLHFRLVFGLQTGDAGNPWESLQFGDLSYRILLRDASRAGDLVSELKAFPGVSRVTSLKAEDESEV